jgi:RNA polymerase sigma factor (sigma-70 family)
VSKKKKKNKPPQPLSNHQLCRGLANGDVDVIAAIYETNRAMVFGEAYGIVRDTQRATDLTHDTFVKLLTHRRTVTKPAQWLRKTVHNRALNDVRNQKLHEEKLAQAERWLAGFAEDPEVTVGVRIDAGRLHALAFEQDSPFGVVERHVLQLILAGTTVIDMARNIGIPESTMRDLRRRVLEELRELLLIQVESRKAL